MGKSGKSIWCHWQLSKINNWNMTMVKHQPSDHDIMLAQWQHFQDIRTVWLWLFLSHRGEGCPVLGFCLANFLFYVENLILLSFQVTSPSSRVTGLTSPLIPWLCPPVSPSLMCVYSPRLSLSCCQYFVSSCTSSCYPQPCQVVKYCLAEFLFS